MKGRIAILLTITLGAGLAAWPASAQANDDKKEKKKKLADLIGSTKPMTAVLFSEQDRNSFEVVKDPLVADDSIGIINQSGSGSTAGILVAAEAPFAYPGGKQGFTVPIGAWFGVNLNTGGGDEVSDVDLAAGFSFAFVSGPKLEKIGDGADPGLAGSAKLLIGVVYGEVASLGPKDSTSNLRPGDSYPLGESPPLRKDREISLAIGIGFRF